jgi:PAS domain S-box-containing protein
MPAAKKPENEKARLESLHALNILDSCAEKEFNAIVETASLVCGVPMSFISLVDTDRQWFKAGVGLPGVTETPRDVAFCAHAIHDDGILEVKDARKDSRFSDNPLVLGDPNIRFYAGATLKLSDGANVGTLCVIDKEAHQLNDTQRAILSQLAVVASNLLEQYRIRENEKKLLEETEFITNMLDHSNDAIISLTVDGLVNYWNKAAEELFGYTANKMIGASLKKLIPANRKNEKQPVPKLLKKLKDGMQYDAVRITSDGQEITVSVSLSPNFDAKGKLIGATKIVRDITNKKQSERLLAENEARFRVLSEASPLGIFATDRQGLCTYTNARWQAMFGLTYEESLGEGWKKSIHPLDRESVFGGWKNATTTHTEFDMEFRLRNANGIVRFVRARGRPVIDEKDQVTGFIGSVEDVTEFRLMLDKLAKKEEEVRSLYESTPAMLQSLDTEGVILSVSDLWLEKHEYSREDVIGRHATEFMTPESADYCKNVVTPEFVANGCVNNVSYQKVTKSGRVFDVVLSSMLEKDADGNPLRAKCALVDVTEENAAKRATDELLHTLRSQFITSITDAKGAIIEVNDAFCEISQYSREELLGQDHRIVNSRTHPKSFFTAMWKVISKGKPWRGEICNRAKDGSLYWVDSVISPVRGTNGKIERYISIRSDVTKRVQSEIEVVEQKQLVHQMLESQSVAAFMIDDKHRVVHWNKACEVLTGVKASDILGKTEAWRGFYDSERPCLADLVLNEQKHNAKDFYPTQGESALTKNGWHAEAWFEKLGGKRRYAIFDATTIRDSNGKVLGALETLQDITEHKLIEQALQEERKNLASVIEGTQAGTWHWNYATGECRFNEMWAEILGYSLKELEPLNADTWRQLVNQDDKQHILDSLNSHFSGESELYEAEFRMAHRDGHWVWVQARGRVLSWTVNGQPEWLHGTHTDITARKMLELDLKQAYHNLDEFTAVASHDLKSPLRGIADLMEWINEDLGTDIDESVKNNLNRVQLRVKRMENLIDDLLQYSRSSETSEETSLVDPSVMLDDILEIQNTPKGFKISVTSKVKPFNTYETPLKTIVRNLLSNAIKHHDKDEGNIEVNIYARKEFIVFEVKDDGPGIPESAQERVFKLFQALSKSNNSTGIGLAVSKRMAEVHGGHIELESDEGKGTTFSVWWPKKKTRIT